MLNREGSDIVLPLFGEDLVVSKRLVETRRVAITRTLREEERRIAELLSEDTVEISREKIGRYVDAMPSITEEGDTFVFPIVEERLVIRRRLFLTEEVRVRRVRASRIHHESVTLRHHDVVISAVPAQTPPVGPMRSGNGRPLGPTFLQNGSETMTYQTVVAAFDSHAHAEAAAQALKAAGFHGDDVSVVDRSEAAGLWAKTKPSLWQRFFGSQVRQHEAMIYDQTVTRGGAIVAARVPNDEVAHATGILDIHHPIDVQDRALTNGVIPAARAGAAAAAAAKVASNAARAGAAAIAPPILEPQKVALPAKLAESNDQILRLAEEQLQVGKRKIETGKTRVRRFMTEQEASADVTLHDEHAEVMRRAVADPKYLGDIDWADSTIEIVDTAEEALVSKTAHVVEEVSLKKIGTDHVQTLHEKLRRQQIEVEQLGPDGKRLAAATR